MVFFQVLILSWILREGRGGGDLVEIDLKEFFLKLSIE